MYLNPFSWLQRPNMVQALSAADGSASPESSCNDCQVRCPVATTRVWLPLLFFKAILRNVDSSLGFVGCTNGPNKFEVIVEETMGSRTRRLTRTDCLPRPGTDGHASWKDVIVPLYISEPK